MRVTNADVAQPGFDLDPTNANAPLFFHGSKPLDASSAPWSTAPIFSRYFDRLTLREYIKRDSANWLIAEQPALNTVYVGANAQYTTLSAALAAITDASDTNEYLIIVNGEIAETVAITAKSHVNVLFLPGASVTVTSTSTLNAVNMSSLSNTCWAAVDNSKPHIIRTGVIGSASHGLYTTGCSSTVRISSLNVSNTTTGGTGCHGIYNNSSSSPTMTNCIGTGGAGGNGCHGIYNNSSSNPTMTNCIGTGGAGGTGCHGIYNNSSSPTMTNCTGTGGAGGASCYGIYNGGSNPTMTNCIGTGGAGGASCHGIYNNSSSPTMTNCAGTGGAGGANGYGIINNSSSPTMTNCIGTGGAGGTGCTGIYNNSSSNPTMTNCAGIGGAGGTGCHGIYNGGSSRIIELQCYAAGGGAIHRQATATIAASSRQEDTFQPGSTFPYRLVSCSINVTAAAAAGVTLTLRDTTGGGGNALSAAIAVDTTGVKNFAITGHHVIAAAGNVFAYLSASDATLAYTVTYTYETNFTTCYALYHDSDSACAFVDCSFVSNAASAAIYVTNNGDDRSAWDGGSARTGLNDAGRSKAFVCQSAWNPASVYNMVLAGGSTNLTCAAGTANGTCVEV